MIDLRDAQLLDFVPESIRSDPEVIAICEALDPELQAVSDSIVEAIILPRISALTEPVLDEIGWMMRLDRLRAWDVADVAGKRRLLANILDLRRRAGTRYAVRRVFDLLLLTATVIEWWEEAATPHTYRIEVDAAEDGVTLLELQQVPDMAKRFARTSQRLSQFAVTLTRTGTVYVYPAHTFGILSTIGSP